MPAAASRHYKARGAALDLWTCRAPEVLLSGPAGTGKSRACLEKLHACALRWPGMRGLIVRKTRESLNESALVTFEDKVLPEGSPIGAGAQRNTRQVYRYPNGSQIVVGGLKQAGRDQKQKIMSTEYDIAYVQEAIELTEEDWENITTRLRNGVMPFQQIMGDTNPDAPTHWIKARESRGDLLLMESRHEDNPTLWAPGGWTEFGKTYISKLDALTGPRKQRLRHGRWVQAEGVVYEGWDRNVHLIDRMPVGWESWRKVRSIDFGYTNPFVCQWWAVDGDGRMYLYRELYQTRRTVAVHAGRIKALSGAETYAEDVADHDAEDRATLYENGIATTPARKFVAPGLQAVEERLKVQGDGKPRLFILRTALVERDESLAASYKPCCTADEFDSYVWPKAADGKPVKEEPVKEHDHGMDAMRYAVMAVDRNVGPLPTPEQIAAEAAAEAARKKAAREKFAHEDNPHWWGDHDAADW